MTSETNLGGSAGWRNRPLVRETDGHRVRSLWRTLLAVVVATAPTAVYLVEQNECIKTAYHVAELQDERDRLETELQQLEAEQAELESLAVIERWALRERGMRQPASEEVVVVRDGRDFPPEFLARAPGHVNGGTLN